MCILQISRYGGLLFLLLFSSLQSVGQRLEVFGGYFPNDYFERQPDEGHYFSEYSDGDGFSIGCSIDSLIYDSLRFRFSISFEQYTGGITEYDGGLGGGYGLKAKSTKSTIGFRFYLINVNIVKELCFNFGGAFNFLIGDDTEGIKEVYNINGFYATYDLSDGSINAPVTFGFIGRVAYNLKVMNSWFVIPQYTVYLGMSPEFRYVTSRTRSFRQYFELGIGRRLH